MVRIGAADAHLDLGLDLDRSPGSAHLDAALAADGLTVRHLVVPSYADDGFGDLAAFFDDLEASWRGWDGPRSWRSLEGELSITAEHTGSHVRLRVELRNDPFGRAPSWAARVDITLDAGAQLSEVAASLRDELTPS